jgi:hypothetical protein
VLNAPTHFHHAHDALQLPPEGDIPLHDDRVGKKCRAVRAEAEIRVTVLDFRRHHQGDAHSGEDGDHSIERLPELLTKRRRQRQLEPGERIDHQPSRLEPVHRVNDLAEHLIDGQIQWARLEDAHFAFADEPIEPLSTGAVLRVLVRPLFEHGDDAGFIETCPLADELAGEHTLARARRPCDEHGIAARNAATEHVVQCLDADREPFAGRGHIARLPWWGLFLRPDDDPGEHLDAALRDAKRVQPGNGRLPTHLHDLHLANHGIPVHALREPQQSVGHGEDRVLFGLRRLILADEKRRRLPGGEPHGQLLHEMLQIEGAVLGHRGGPGHRAEGIDDDHAGVRGFHLPDDARQELLQRAVNHFMAQIDVSDRLVHACQVEERVLLLIAQHLEGRFADHREVQRGTLGTGEREHDLLRERRLPRTRGAGNEIEGELRQASTQDLVESGNASGKAPYHYPFRHALCLLGSTSVKASGHASCNRRVVSACPMNVTSNSVSVARMAPAASVATAGACCSRQNTTCANGPLHSLASRVAVSHGYCCCTRYNARPVSASTATLPISGVDTRARSS